MCMYNTQTTSVPACRLCNGPKTEFRVCYENFQSIFRRYFSHLFFPENYKSAGKDKQGFISISHFSVDLNSAILFLRFLISQAATFFYSSTTEKMVSRTATQSQNNGSITAFAPSKSETKHFRSATKSCRSTSKILKINEVIYSFEIFFDQCCQPNGNRLKEVK